MASLDLSRLWKLHQIDAGIVEIRNRAAALDPGRSLAAQLESLQAEETTAAQAARTLQSELTDLELAQKGIEDKLKRVDREIYGGKVVNPREVENLEREIASLKAGRDRNDERILELWELIPPAKKIAEDAAAKVEQKKQELAAHRKRAMEEKERLEAEFKRLSLARPEAAQGISPSLVARYDVIRQKHQGIGMAEVKKTRACGACGTAIAERTIDALRSDKVAACESCHRILYYSEGIV